MQRSAPHVAPQVSAASAPDVQRLESHWEQPEVSAELSGRAAVAAKGFGKAFRDIPQAGFFGLLGICMIFQSKGKSKACGCVGEIRIPSSVQSLEIHPPHNVKAFPFTIYKAPTPRFTGCLFAQSWSFGHLDAAPCRRPTGGGVLQRPPTALVIHP